MPAERIEAPLPLIQCPFCGGEAKLFFIKEEHPFVHRVGCIGECKTTFGHSYSYSGAITACKHWNQRADAMEGVNLHPPTPASQNLPLDYVGAYHCKKKMKKIMCDIQGCDNEAELLDEMDNYYCESCMLIACEEENKIPSDFEWLMDAVIKRYKKENSTRRFE